MWLKLSEGRGNTVESWLLIGNDYIIIVGLKKDYQLNTPYMSMCFRKKRMRSMGVTFSPEDLPAGSLELGDNCWPFTEEDICF